MGNFDGFHKGHMLLLQEAEKRAAQYGTTISILTFYPHPQRLFFPQKPCFFITSLRAKLRIFKGLKINHVFLCKFTKELARMDQDTFIETFLKGMIHPKYIVIGEDFHFGKNKGGGYKSLQDSGFDISVIKRDKEYSSSHARNLIEAGDMKGVHHILGRPYEVEGFVQAGLKHARELGYPTANLYIHHYIQPALGVYATQTLIDGKWLDSLSFFGNRRDQKEPVLETHIFNLKRNLYHKRIRVRFIDFIRQPKKFENTFEIANQIEKDAEIAQKKLQHFKDI